MTRFLNLLMPALIFVAAANESHAQEVEKKRLMRNINVPTKSHIFPSLSGDGMFMIFYSDYSNTGTFELKYSKKTGYEFWEEAKYVENLVKHHNDHFGSYCVSYDGQSIVFSSYRANGIGKYDILMSERNGDSWSVPVNPGKPLNSPSNDGNPCLSPDGKSIYFMRCADMDAKTKSGCKIYVAKKISENRWGEPVALPEKINAYNSTTPRILIDNETLYYSSERPGGKGGLDLYMTRNIQGGWTDPIPLDFLNTPRNDEFVSVPARGDIIYYTDVYKDQNNIFKAIIPVEYRPKKIALITGKISYTDATRVPENIVVQAIDVNTGNVVTSVKPNEQDGSFFISLPEGKIYDFSIFPMDGDHSYYAELYDLKDMPNPRWEKMDIPLEPIGPGTVLNLSTIQFSPGQSVSHNSSIEFRRLSAVLKKNPSLNAVVGVSISKVITDSIPRDGLNKVITDTTFLALNKAEMFRSGNDFGTAQEDSLSTLGYMFLEDNDTKTIYYKIKYTYTNDDTQEKAEAVVEKLKEAGVPEYRLIAKGYGDSKPDEAAASDGYAVQVKFVVP